MLSSIRFKIYSDLTVLDFYHYVCLFYLLVCHLPLFPYLLWLIIKWNQKVTFVHYSYWHKQGITLHLFLLNFISYLSSHLLARLYGCMHHAITSGECKPTCAKLIRQSVSVVVTQQQQQPNVHSGPYCKRNKVLWKISDCLRYCPTSLHWEHDNDKYICVCILDLLLYAMNGIKYCNYTKH